MAVVLLVVAEPVRGLVAQSQHRPFAHLTTNEGLSNNAIVDIVQDPQGFIWIATHNGLNRYDGRTVKQFFADPADSTSLDFDNLAKLYIDQKGQLWVSSKGGTLHRYDPATETFTRYTLPLEADGSAVVEYIHESADGTFWLASWQHGLWRFDPSTGAMVNYRHHPDDPFSLGHNVVKDILGNPDGTLWLATYAGLNLFDPKTGRALHYPIPVEPEQERTRRSWIMWDVHRDLGGSIWVGTFGGLYRFIPATGTYVPYLPDPANPNGPSHHEVRAIHEDHEGALWIGYVSGLDRFDPQTGIFESFSHDPFISQSLPAGSIYPIFQDRSGILWVGTDRRGVSRTDLVARRIQYQQASAGDPGGLRPGLIHSVLQAQDDALWLGGEAGLARVHRGTGQVQHFTPEAHNLPRGIITDLVETPDGTLWVASEGGGVGRLQTSGTFERFSFDEERDNFVYNLVPAQEGGFWVGGFNGFFRWSPEAGISKVYRPDPANPEALRHGFIMALHEDDAGMLWAGTETGLTRLDPSIDQITNYTHVSGDTTSLFWGPVHAIHEGRNHDIWLAGAHGLSRLDPETEQFRHLNVANERLPTNTIYSLISDADGVFWLHTDIGILRFDPDTGDVYNAEPDIVNMPTDISFGAAHRNAQGELFFGALDGFYTFSPQDLAINPHAPAVALTELRVSDEVVEPAIEGPLAEALPVADRIELAYQDRIVSLDFAALHFSKPSANLFSFQLEGFDATWRGPTRNASVTYTNLDPGAYTLRVRAANSDGVWSTEEATLVIDVEPPWWGTVWFRVLLGIGVLASMAAAYSWRMRSVQQQKHRLEEQVHARTEEIEAQRATLEVQARKLLATDELKSNFFANTSHELRTPLTLIRGNLEDVIEDTELRLNAQTWKRLTVAMGQTERLQQLVEQLLDLSRLQSNQLRLHAHYADVGQFVKRVLSAFQSVAQQQQLTLTYRAPEAPTWIYFDSDKLEKVVTNLIGNALKFTPTGGHVQVGVGHAPVGGDGYGTGEFVCVHVTDTGEGISEDALPYIFDRFYQADGSITRTREGMGLGLALAKELTDLHGGEIQCTSVVGHGTTFSVLLPKGRAHLADDEIAAVPLEESTLSSAGMRALLVDADAPVAASEATSENAHTVLVVEDNRELRDYLATHLRSTYRVVEADNGEAGLRLAQQHRPDLIVSDVMMPRMDGFSMLRAIKDDPDLATIPVILLTAKASDADQQEGLEAEAAHYIAKPFKMPDVKLRIQNLLTDRARFKEAFRKQKREAFMPRTSLDAADAAFLEKARACVEVHLQDKGLNVKGLAEVLFVSESTLRRRLQELTGLSAAAYIRQIRLAYAKQYLEQQAYKTLAEVATAVGFSNAHYFARVFKQTYEVSPSELLRSES